MSQFETDRENDAVGPEICEGCEHPLRLHGPDGCQFELGDHWVTGNQSDQPTVLMARGPCGCSATTLEPCDEPLEDAIGQDLFQATLAVSYSRYILNSTRNLVGYIYGSSPLVHKHRVIA